MTDTDDLRPQPPYEQLRRRLVDYDNLLPLLEEAFGPGGPQSMSFHGTRPLMSLADQRHPNGVLNPYWEVARRMPAYWRDRPWADAPAGQPQLEYMPICRDLPLGTQLWEAGGFRDALVATYAYSIPSPGDVEWMVRRLQGRGVVEVGAGTGYWAWQLAQAGVDVVAYDDGRDGQFVGGPYYPVTRADAAEAAASHRDRALLMCWPPRHSDMAERTLDAYRGDLVISASMQSPEICGSGRFWRTLRRQWSELGRCPEHVTFEGMECFLEAWSRPAGNLTRP